MNILAFDTSLGAISAAVSRRGPEGRLRRVAYGLRTEATAQARPPA